MSDHDPLCPITTWRLGEEYRERCECHLIARVRADERRRELLAVCRCGCMERDAYAEQVAAKLVEVICDDAAVMAWDLKALEATARERDAARAEAAKYSAEIDRMVGELSAIRAEHEAEVAALREQYVVEEFIDTDGYPSMRVVKGEHVSENEWAANIRREVLADLRAKVEALDESGDFLYRRAVDQVLALIEEVS